MINLTELQMSRKKLLETEGRQFESAAVADEVIDLMLSSEDDEI